MGGGGCFFYCNICILLYFLQALSIYRNGILRHGAKKSVCIQTAELKPSVMFPLKIFKSLFVHFWELKKKKRPKPPPADKPMEFICGIKYE